MKKIKIKYGQRVNYIFALTLVIGIAFSSLVYWQGTEVSSKTQALITEEIPNYELLRTLSNSLTEQERILYEYYADEDVERFNEFKSISLNINRLLNELLTKFGNIEPLIKTQEAAFEIGTVGVEFSATMLARGTNAKWIKAREQLKEISRIRREALLQIELLLTITAESVAESEGSILDNLEHVRIFVVCYSIFTLFIAYIVAEAFKAYLQSSATNQRLSLFPMRNPNPIISIDQNNAVTFTNPATQKLLLNLGLGALQVSELLAIDLKERQQKVISSKDTTSATFQYEFKGLALQCEIHWLEDQQQWDLHLSDISERVKAEKELNFLAYHNPETKLGNQYKLAQDVEALYKTKKLFSLGIIEIRSYSQLISGRGIDTAIQVTKEISNALVKTSLKVCPDDNFTVYHIGEKSFAVLATVFLHDNGIFELIDIMNKEIGQTVFSNQSQVQLDYGFCFAPEHGKSYIEILKNARTALDTSARADDSQHVIYNHELGARLAHEQLMISDMRDALENDDFELHFQPQLCLDNTEVIGAEVLIRWNNKGKWVSPGEFIPLAETSGFIIKLGDWILRKACEQGLKLIEAGFTELVIAVNISPKQFGRSDFLEKVTNVLKETGLPPQNLELEITEGVIIYNEEETIETLASLKKLGFMLAIDDFGTGYSSLSYLKKFDIDKLKIDQSFVRHIQTEKADESIVRTIIDLGRNLELKLIAEGVEEIEQLDILKSLGCDEIQGYFFSKPLPEESFIEFIKMHRE